MSRDKESDRLYQLARYHKVRAWMLDLLGKRCVECGSIDNLQIDHIDNKKTKISLAKKWGMSKTKLTEELKDCQLLCHDCHDDKSIAERGHKRAEHGTLTMYRHHGCRCRLCLAVGRKKAREYSRRYRSKKAGII